MRREGSFLVILMLSSSLAMSCSAVDIDLTRDFPRWRNGENNIYLQYREDGEYHDLVPMSYVVFAHPNSPSTIPYAGPVISLGTRANLTAESYVNPDRIYIRPSMEEPSEADRAGVIRIIPPLPDGRVDIVGEAGMEGILVPMAIYHGEANYARPTWSSTAPGPFSVNYTFTNGEPVFFAASAPSNDPKFKGYWKGVILSFTNGSEETQSGSGTRPPSTGGPTGTVTGTQASQADIPSSYVQAGAVIVAALIGSATTIWVARHKKE
jgi:hypothetical protein